MSHEKTKALSKISSDEVIQFDEGSEDLSFGIKK